MGPYGSVWAHIKTGRSPMAHDHFQTPPDPKRGYYIVVKDLRIKDLRLHIPTHDPYNAAT